MSGTHFPRRLPMTDFRGPAIAGRIATPNELATQGRLATEISASFR